MTRVDPTGRRRARESALQMLYQAEVGRMGPQETIGSYWRLERSDDHPEGDAPAGGDAEMSDKLREFANELVKETTTRVVAFDQLLGAHAHNWRLERMAVIDRLVLLV
jgi:N utilization substance protein B